MKKRFIFFEKKRIMKISFLNSSLNCILLQKLVIKTKSVEYMPFFLSLFSFLNGACWTSYALIRFDAYILVSINKIQINLINFINIFFFYYFFLRKRVTLAIIDDVSFFGAEKFDLLMIVFFQITNNA